MSKHYSIPSCSYKLDPISTLSDVKKEAEDWSRQLTQEIQEMIDQQIFKAWIDFDFVYSHLNKDIW